MTISRTLVFAAAVVAALTIPASIAEACSCCGCSDSETAAAPTKHGKTIVQTAQDAGSFGTLLAAAKAAGLVDLLNGDGPFTVFAPADQAFAKLPKGTIEALLADKPKLRSILTYHVVPGRLTAADVVKKTWLETAQGQSLKVSVSGNEVRIDGSRIVATDIEASNGIIHVIDTVALPRKDIVDTAASTGTFKTLLAAAKAAGLVPTLKSDGPFTLFAPSDAAFAKLPAGTVEALLKDIPKLKFILTYHVVPGRILAADVPMAKTAVKTANGRTVEVVRSKDGSVKVNDARVVAADVIAANGIVHVIDTVVVPHTN